MKPTIQKAAQMEATTAYQDSRWLRVRQLSWWVYVIFGALVALFCVDAVHAQATRTYCTELSVTTSTQSPYITLNWPLSASVTSQTLWVRAKGSATWSAISLSTTATSYADVNAQPGVVYEYSFKATSSSSPTSIYGSIAAGYNIPLVENRGKVILLVDNTMAAPLTPELNQLQKDLVADGWIIYRHDVARMAVDPSTTSSTVYASRLAEVQAVRTLVQNDYNSAPDNNWALMILGRVPIPYSGAVGPDGHGSRSWPTDSYYADVNGVWTDSTLTLGSSSWSDPRGQNAPGDGKFDQSIIPSAVELQSGRVDLSNMVNAPSGMTETQLLRQYLVRDDRFRRAQAPFDSVSRRALIEDNFNNYGGVSLCFAADAWRTGFAFFGRNAGQTDTGNWFPDLETSSALLAANYASGGYQFIGSNGSYSYFTQVDFNYRTSKAVFGMVFGSYEGDWDVSDNFLRAPLAGTQDSLGLCRMWSGRGYYQIFHMALGETIGYGIRYTQNNTGNYLANTGDWIQSEADPAGYLKQVTYGLMGDPTLRLHSLPPPTKVAAVSSIGKIDLSWTPSTDVNVVGYQVYRSTSVSGPFTRISGVTASGTNPTGSPIVGATYSDTDSSLVAGTTYTYLVKAVKMETTPSGNYANQSLGEAVTVTHLAMAPLAPTRLRVSRTDASTSVLIWDDNASDETGYLVERFSPSTYSWSQIASLGANTTTYTDNATGTEGKIVYYRVRASGSSVNSGYSNEAAEQNLAGLIYATEYAVVATKSGNTATFHATRYNGTSGSVTATYSTSAVSAVAGTDYVTTNGTITWAHGETGTKSGSISVLSPSGTQLTKVVKITYNNPSNGAAVQPFRPSTVLYIADPAAQALTPPWSTTAFGTWMSGDSGYAEQVGSTYGVLTNRGYIYDGVSEDSVRYLYQAINGDFTFSAKLALQSVPLSPYVPLGAYGLMMRSALTSTASMNAVYMTSNPAVKQLARTATSSNAGSATTVSWGAMTRWLKMVRNGSSLTSFQSNDGVTWTQIGSTVTISTLPPTVYLGFFGAANNTPYNLSTRMVNDMTEYTYAQLSNVTLDVTPYIPVDNIASFTAVPGAAAGSITLNWSATNGANSYLIERSTLSNNGFVQIASVTAPTLAYTDSNLTVNTTYYYRAKAINSAYQSAYTSVVSSVPYLPAGMAGWRYIYFGTTAVQSGYSDDLDMPGGDQISNVMAYALGGLNPNSYKSLTKLPTVQVQTVNSIPYLTCSFTHNTAATDLQISIEVASDMNGPWSTIDPLAAVNQVSVASNTPSTGLETIVVKDTQPLSASTKRFMHFKVTHGSNVDSVSPQGYVTLNVAPGTGSTYALTAISLPLSRSYQGAGHLTDYYFTAVGTNTLSNAYAGWTASAFATTGSPYALRVTTGTSAGRLYAITANTSKVLTLDTQGDDLTTLISDWNTNTDGYEIFPLDTLLSFFGTPATTGILGGTSGSQADQVMIFNGGVWNKYYFNTTSNDWRQVGFETASNNVILRPERAIFYNRLGTAALSFTQVGRVPTVQRIIPVANSGFTYISTGWPAGQTLGTCGIQQIPGWVSNTNSNNVDTVQIFGSGVWTKYYHDGTQWRKVGFKTPSNNALISMGGGLIINKIGSATGTTPFTQALPYILP